MAAGACALLISLGAAKADTIMTFDVSATINNGDGTETAACNNCSLGGTIGIDVTNGDATSQDVTVTGASLGPFTTLDFVSSLGPTPKCSSRTPLEIC